MGGKQMSNVIYVDFSKKKSFLQKCYDTVTSECLSEKEVAEIVNGLGIKDFPVFIDMLIENYDNIPVDRAEVVHLAVLDRVKRDCPDYFRSFRDY
jgi:hypothetical protein